MEANVLGMLFGLQVGFTRVSAYKLFIDEHRERLNNLAKDYILLNGVDANHIVATYRAIRSAEFKKLSQEELDDYTEQARTITRENKEYAERPATDNDIYE